MATLIEIVPGNEHEAMMINAFEDYDLGVLVGAIFGKRALILCAMIEHDDEHQFIPLGRIFSREEMLAVTTPDGEPLIIPPSRLMD